MNRSIRENLPRYGIGGAAIGISLLLFFRQETTPLLVIAVLYLLVICTIDTLYSKIPNLCNLALLLAGLTYNLFTHGISGGGQALLGFVVGLSLLLFPYLMGGIGGGDVKAFAALGTLLGPNAVFQVFLYTGLLGGLLAVLHYLLQRNLLAKLAAAGRALAAFAGSRDRRCLQPQATEKLRFPYAAAIALGFCCYVSYGGIFTLLQTLLLGRT